MRLPPKKGPSILQRMLGLVPEDKKPKPMSRPAAFIPTVEVRETDIELPQSVQDETAHRVARWLHVVLVDAGMPDFTLEQDEGLSFRVACTSLEKDHTLTILATDTPSIETITEGDAQYGSLAEVVASLEGEVPPGVPILIATPDGQLGEHVTVLANPTPGERAALERAGVRLAPTAQGDLIMYDEPEFMIRLAEFLEQQGMRSESPFWDFINPLREAMRLAHEDKERREASAVPVGLPPHSYVAIFLSKNPDTAYTADELAVAMDTPLSNINECLPELIKQGRVARVGGGYRYSGKHPVREAQDEQVSSISDSKVVKAGSPDNSSERPGKESERPGNGSERPYNGGKSGGETPQNEVFDPVSVVSALKKVLLGDEGPHEIVAKVDVLNSGHPQKTRQVVAELILAEAWSQDDPMFMGLIEVLDGAAQRVAEAEPADEQHEAQVDGQTFEFTAAGGTYRVVVKQVDNTKDNWLIVESNHPSLPVNQVRSPGELFSIARTFDKPGAEQFVAYARPVADTGTGAPTEQSGTPLNPDLPGSEEIPQGTPGNKALPQGATVPSRQAILDQWDAGEMETREAQVMLEAYAKETHVPTGPGWYAEQAFRAGRSGAAHSAVEALKDLIAVHKRLYRMTAEEEAEIKRVAREDYALNVQTLFPSRVTLPRSTAHEAAVAKRQREAEQSKPGGADA